MMNELEISKLALSRVDELERRINDISNSNYNFVSFELKNDSALERVTNKTNYLFEFESFVPVGNSQLWVMFCSDIYFYNLANCQLVLKANDSIVLNQTKSFKGAEQVFVFKVVDVYDQTPLKLSIEIVGDNLDLLINNYSLTVMGLIKTAPESALSPKISADIYGGSSL